MSIKYYQLAKDEEPPDEFCVIRDIGGEPSEYTFYVPEAENAKLREEFDKMDVWHSKELTAAMAEIGKLREMCSELLRMAESNDPDFLHWPEIHDELRKLGVKIVKI